MSPFIVDMHPTIYSDSKEIYTIESTVEDLHKALQDVETLLSVLLLVIFNEYFEKYSAFPMPRVIPQYENSYKYTTQITSSVSNKINQNAKAYAAPTRNVWNRGPLKVIQQSANSQQTNTSNITTNTKK
eukprot:1721624-Ditylum_brightwellii.AAC.1